MRTCCGRCKTYRVLFYAIFAVFGLCVLTLSFPVNADAANTVKEREYNGSFSTATPIKLNQTVKGKIGFSTFEVEIPVPGFEDIPPGSWSGTYGDCDYYKFKVPVSGKVKMTFTQDDSGMNIAYDNIYIYTEEYASKNDGEFRDVGGRHFDTPFPEFINGKIAQRKCESTLYLTKGTYYIVIEPWQIYSEKSPSYHFKLTYEVDKTKIKRIVGSKRSFTVKWGKKNDATKYQLRYSPISSMKGAKTLTISKASNSKKIKKLSANKKYYVQVRVVKKIGGSVYYSDWCAKKVIRTK